MITQITIIIINFFLCLIISFILGTLWQKGKIIQFNLKTLNEIKKEPIPLEAFNKLPKNEQVEEYEKVLVRRGMMELMAEQLKIL